MDTQFLQEGGGGGWGGQVGRVSGEAVGVGGGGGAPGWLFGDGGGGIGGEWERVGVHGFDPTSQADAFSW